ncbi:hypothetical protein BDP27DRAFT_1364553 [Rhodocollybia butyracea]|uniref:Uncharacterized protein n=1 Tax=Rhodocollybia butyracea TaxID=206335 RepID=A0A9P5PL80_9AGAR|nr:hypothetical protein BDP27DRAFT_1364553 [Rhodocollybia butyracea]
MRSIAFATLLATITAGLAAVTPELSTRQGGSSGGGGNEVFLIFCTEPNLEPNTCQIAGVLNTCTPFVAPFDDSIESLANTFAGVACAVYVNDDCTGDSLIVANLAEFDNLGVSNPNLNNALNSFQCIGTA